MVLEPAALADLLAFLVFRADARQADEGRSFFSKKGGGNRDRRAGARREGDDLFGPGAPAGADAGVRRGGLAAQAHVLGAERRAGRI